MGPKYAILRNEFTNMDQIQVKKNNILVTFGGGDDKGAILITLSAIKDLVPNGYKVIIVVGKHNPRKNMIREWISSNNKKTTIRTFSKSRKKFLKSSRNADSQFLEEVLHALKQLILVYL